MFVSSFFDGPLSGNLLVMASTPEEFWTFGLVAMQCHAMLCDAAPWTMTCPAHTQQQLQCTHRLAWEGHTLRRCLDILHSSQWHNPCALCVPPFWSRSRDSLDVLVREPFKIHLQGKNRRRARLHTPSNKRFPAKNPSKKKQNVSNMNNTKPQSKTRTRSIQLERPNSVVLF